MEYTVYILYSKKFDKYYIGQTNSFSHRLAQHNGDEAGYTKKYQPWEVIYTEVHLSRKDAMKVEKYIKSLKNKERIQQYINGWRSRRLIS